MTILDHPQYKELASKIVEGAKGKYNLVLVSLPGSGATFFAKKMVESNLVESISYICEEAQMLSTFNILDFDFNKNPKALGIVDSYIKQAGTNQKFLVIINTPEILKTPSYLGSITSNRVYDYVYMPQMDEYRATILATNSKVNFDEELIKRVVAKTGGIARLVKYFLIHQDQIDLDLSKLMEFGEFKAVFEPTVKSTRQCDFRTLNLLGVTKRDIYTSPVLNEYFETHPRIDISFELGGVVIENGKRLEEKFLKHEVEMLKVTLENEGVLTKEKISDVRWGENSYEKFSDQAIKKIILRINKKLEKYVFVAVPTIGYKLIERV